MDHGPSVEDTRSLLWRTGRWIIGLFWLVRFLELTLIGVLQGGEKALRLIEPRALHVVAGVILTAPLVEVAAISDGMSFTRRLSLTIATALAMCVLLMDVNYSIFHSAAFAGRIELDPVDFMYVAFGYSWFFLGLAGAVVGLAYSVEIRDRERRSRRRTCAADRFRGRWPRLRGPVRQRQGVGMSDVGARLEGRFGARGAPRRTRRSGFRAMIECPNGGGQ